MKFSCEKYLLLQAVNTASRCAALKSPIPAVEGLLIQAEKDVKITGYDLKKGIYTSFPADISERGSVVLNAKLFGEIVRSLPDDIVRIEMKDSYKTKIICGPAEFSIMGSDSSEYPELPSIDQQNQFSFSQKKISDMIRQTIFAVSDNESRPVYTGGLIEIKDNEIVMVCVDGYRLALRREKLENEECGEFSFIVPGNALSDLEKLCCNENENVFITVGAKHVSFSIGDTVLVSRRLEGEFLNYKRSIPEEFSTVAEVRKDEFSKSVSRVSLMIDEKFKTPLCVKIGRDGINMSCATGIGHGEDECSVTLLKGNEITIGFNNRYLLDALKAAPSDILHLCFNSPSSPCIICPRENTESFSYMILPVRIKTE